MNVLVCNDDGIYSEGIIALALMLYKKGYNVTVVAPANNCSGYGHYASFYKPVEVRKEQYPEGIEAYSLSGSPVDCVIYGLRGLNRKFDLVCSGINRGSNLGSEVLYSGTVAVGAEANSLGMKAIAFSCTDYKNSDFNRVAELCGDVLHLFSDSLSPDFTLNVNIPPLNSINKEIKVTPLGVRLYTDVYEWQSDSVFMLTGTPIDCDNPEDCDVEWNKKNYITVTPIIKDRSGYAQITALKDKN